MKIKTLLMLGLMAYALTATLNAQTIGGDTGLNSKSWTWTAVDDTIGISTYTLFTAPATGDYLITVYLSVDPTTDNNACPTPIVTFSDEHGAQQAYLITLNDSLNPGFGGNNFVVTWGEGSGVIHAVANSAVQVSVSDLHNCTTTPAGNYTFVVTKTKLNP